MEVVGDLRGFSATGLHLMCEGFCGLSYCWRELDRYVASEHVVCYTLRGAVEVVGGDLE